MTPSRRAPSSASSLSPQHDEAGVPLQGRERLRLRPEFGGAVERRDGGGGDSDGGLLLPDGFRRRGIIVRLRGQVAVSSPRPLSVSLPRVARITPFAGAIENCGKLQLLLHFNHDLPCFNARKNNNIHDLVQVESNW